MSRLQCKVKQKFIENKTSLKLQSKNCLASHFRKFQTCWALPLKRDTSFIAVNSSRFWRHEALFRMLARLESALNKDVKKCSAIYVRSKTQ